MESTKTEHQAAVLIDIPAILEDLRDSLLRARRSRDVVWSETLAIQEAEEKLGRRLTDAEYEEAMR